MTDNKLLERLFTESPEFARLYQEVQQGADREAAPTPRVVVCGLLKAGKSSLLNALTGNLEHEYFATKASRATTRVAELTFGGLTYVDTPGLDANEADDDEAWRGILGADHLLFVHNLRVAALDTKEVAFLEELVRRQRDAAAKLTVALTQADSVSDSADERIAELGSSLEAVLGVRPTMIATSFTRYRKGVLENKPALVSASAIDRLQQGLQGLHAGTWRAARKRQERSRRRQLDKLLSEAVGRREDELAGLQQRRTEALAHLRKDLRSVLASIGERMAHYATL